MSIILLVLSSEKDLTVGGKVSNKLTAEPFCPQLQFIIFFDAMTLINSIVHVELKIIIRSPCFRAKILV